MQWDERHKEESSPFQALHWELSTPNFLPTLATAWLFHLQFLLFRWVGITPINIDGIHMGVARLSFGGSLGRHMWAKGLCRQGGSRIWGVSNPCREGEVMGEPSLSLPSCGWYSTAWKLGTASGFSEETKKSERILTALESCWLLQDSFFSRCYNTLARGIVHIQRRQGPGFHIQWPHLAGKWESSCPWPQRASPKWYLLILSVSKNPFQWNVQK